MGEVRADTNVINVEKIRALGNKERLKILEKLNSIGPLSWSEIKNELKINPNSLNFHLSKLLNNELIVKKGVLDKKNHAGTSYSITKDGIKSLEGLTK
jgi:DNA-binding HxlR family transcriptional regulator